MGFAAWLSCIQIDNHLLAWWSSYSSHNYGLCFHSTGMSILYLQPISKLTSQCEIRTLWPELTTNNRVLSFDKDTIGFQGATSSEEGEPILLDPDPAKYWHYICTVPLGPYSRVWYNFSIDKGSVKGITGLEKNSAHPLLLLNNYERRLSAGRSPEPYLSADTQTMEPFWKMVSGYPSLC